MQRHENKNILFNKNLVKNLVEEAKIFTLTKLEPLISTLGYEKKLNKDDSKTYAQLLWVLMDANERNTWNQYFENSENDISTDIDEELELECYKLAAMFGNVDQALAYLTRFNKQYQGNQMLHDACLFSLPPEDYNQTLWRGLLKNNKPSHFNDLIMRITPFYLKIEEYVKDHQSELEDNIKNEVNNEFQEKYKIEYEKNEIDKETYETLQKYVDAQLDKNKKFINSVAESKIKNILSQQTSIKTLKDYLNHLQLYEKASSNPIAAKLFFSHQMPEESFNKYLTLKPADDSEKIPDIKIDCGEISPEYKSYYICKLSALDPRAAILGKLTSCCQALGLQGEECAINGIEDPNAGFYILCKDVKNEQIILSQCWAWRDTKNNLVFDSIESQIYFAKENEILICDAFTFLGFKLVTEHNIKRVLVGEGGATPESLNGINIGPGIPKHYDGYRDSHKQSILAENNKLILDAYLEHNPNSKIKNSVLKLENVKTTWISEMFTYYLANYKYSNVENNFIRMSKSPNSENLSILNVHYHSVAQLKGVYIEHDNKLFLYSTDNKKCIELSDKVETLNLFHGILKDRTIDLDTETVLSRIEDFKINEIFKHTSFGNQMDNFLKLYQNKFIESIGAEEFNHYLTKLKNSYALFFYMKNFYYDEMREEINNLIEAKDFIDNFEFKDQIITLLIASFSPYDSELNKIKLKWIDKFATSELLNEKIIYDLSWFIPVSINQDNTQAILLFLDKITQENLNKYGPSIAFICSFYMIIANNDEFDLHIKILNSLKNKNINVNLVMLDKDFYDHGLSKESKRDLSYKIAIKTINNKNDWIEILLNEPLHLKRNYHFYKQIQSNIDIYYADNTATPLESVSKKIYEDALSMADDLLDLNYDYEYSDKNILSYLLFSNQYLDKCSNLNAEEILTLLLEQEQQIVIDYTSYVEYEISINIPENNISHYNNNSIKLLSEIEFGSKVKEILLLLHKIKSSMKIERSSHKSKLTDNKNNNKDNMIDHYSTSNNSIFKLTKHEDSKKIYL